MKRIATKIFSTIAAISIFTCSATVNSSALNIDYILKLFPQYNNILCIINKNNCTNAQTCSDGNCTSTCTGGSCSQTEVIIPTANTTEANEVFNLVNKERKAADLNMLTLSDELCKVAEIRAKEIVTKFSHTRPNGTSCFTAFKENSVNYRYAGENIAYGQRTATIVMNAWMNSTGHRANILNKNFGKIGIACYEYGGKKYWVQLFTD